jgi:tetratricopeptide (TPR) repeat protein
MKTALLLAVLALPAFSQSPAELSARAQELAGQKRFAEAEKLWKQALAGNSDFFPALFNLGYMYQSAGQPAEAKPWLEHAARVNRGDFNTRYLLGSAILALGDREGALRRWREALRLQPENLKLMQVMVVEYEKGLYYSEAEALARRVLERAPEDLNAYLLAVHACQNARDLVTGLEIANRAAERFPDSARANFEYGFHLQRAGRLAESVDYLKKAMELDPKYEEPFFFYGDLLVTEGRDDAAIPYLRQAIANRTDYLPPRLSLARALMHLERWQDAAGELEGAVRVDPEHPEPHVLLSRLYFRAGDEVRAARERDLSLRLRRDNPHALEAPQGRRFPQ